VRQTIGGQCSGVLLMARLGLLADQPAATDLTTRPG
jgi:transcriptional regulator GlxA family with amidase domain